jgi:putative transferase (TIGR04331 family)
MNPLARYLISTADERTWKFDQPVIFLGEWCCNYDRRHIWQDMDAIVAAPYGLGQVKKDADHAEARALEEQLFPVLCTTLNRHHGTQHGPRFWRIVLGHWLRRYVDVMLNRVRTLEQCLQMHQISGTTSYANDHYALATQDSYAAIWVFNDERWNNALNVRILDLVGTERCLLEIIPDCVSPSPCLNALATTLTLKRKVLKWCYQRAGKLASYLVRDDDAFIISSQLPKKEAIKLHLALGQCPQLWVSSKLEITEAPDRTLRESLANQVISKPEKNLKDILSVMVFELLPVCYLEGFTNLNKLVKKQSWPIKPKFILTSNNFDTDEVFKLWAADKAESGSRYITGQHGNNYSTHRYVAPAVEEATADKFLTWGWTDGLPQHSPAFILKTAGKMLGKYDKKGGLLLIEICINHRITTWDVTAEFDEYFQDQQRFINALTDSQRQHLTVRLHAGYRYAKWSEEARWQAFDPSLKIDTGGIAIKDLIAKSRIVIHSYDSTGILETLSQNIPTLAFWQNEFAHVSDSAKPYYQLLFDAGIIQLTPESVAHKVNEVWDDVDGWWRQSKVQDARKQFCDRYARVNQYPVRELKNILSRYIL